MILTPNLCNAFNLYPDFTQALKVDVKGLKMGIPKEYFTSGIVPEVEQAVQKAIQSLESLETVSTEDKEKIMGLNALRLFNLGM